MEIDYLENKWTKLVNKIVLLKNNKHYRFGILKKTTTILLYHLRKK